jgi:hypothetical protein
VSPILVRPVREQLEHDRIIRLLQAKSRRRFEVGINPGSEQNASVAAGTSTVFPDLVLHSMERGKRLQAVVEVETGESVNHLEALAQWAHFGRLRAAFHLYVPAGMVEVARRLCDDNQIHVSEIWSYFTVGEDVRFTLVHRTRETAPAARAARSSLVAKPKPSPAAKPKPSAAKPKPPTSKRAAHAKPARPKDKKPARPQKRK